MRFLSDILAKAGLIVDGAAVFNSSATGQTPASNDNSTNFATTAWVRSFVQPYTLPIASSTVLGGIKVGTGLAIDALTGVLSVSGGSIALKSTQTFTATEGQSIFTIANGYTPGLIDVFLNGVYLSPGQTTATNGSTVTLADPAIAGDIIDVIITSPIGEGSVATTDSLPEGTVNLYYTPARVRTAISLTTTGVSGVATYDNLTGVFNIPNYQGLVPANGLAGQILAKASATSYDTTWIDNYTSQVQHYVKLSVAMTAGTAVYVSGSTGGSGTNMIVSKASNASEGTSSKTLGLIASSGAANDQVFVITEGLLAGLDTSTANAGDPVWLGTNGNLIFGLANKPTAPAHLVFIGVVTRVQSNNGEIFVKVQNGFELDELHDLSVKNASDGDMIKYVASTGLWTKIAASTTNIVEGTNLYYTDARVSAYLTANSYATQGYVNTAISNLVASAPTTLDTLNELATALGNDPNFATTIATSIGTKVPQTRTITINGTAYDLSADRSWSIAAGVTSFNTRTGAITLTSGDVTGALGYTPYNSTNPNGYISSYTETDTLATVTARGATSSTNITLSGNGNTFSGHHYFSPYDVDGNHYPHYNAGANANGSKLNLRMFDNAGNIILFHLNGSSKAIEWNGNSILHAGNYSSYALALSGGTLTGQLTITGARLLLQSGGENTYGLVSGYNNNNHFITMRASVSGATSSPTITGSHQTTFVEYADAGDTSGWYFKSSNTGTYEEIAKITRTGIKWGGNTVWHAGNLTNLNQLTNGPGYITGYTETDTLATVTARGASTSTLITLNNNLYFGNSGTTKRGIQGTSGVNDQWFVGGGATAENAGFLEISTGDDGQTSGASEPIYVRQYGPGDPLTGTLFRSASLLDANGNTSFPGTVTASGLTINTGGTGTWGPFVVTSTALWGDGATQYVTIGAGGSAGIMLFNPHVVWNSTNSCAAIRIGRSGGVSTGNYYEIGTGASNNFFIAKEGLASGTQLNINSSGNATFSGNLSATKTGGTNSTPGFQVRAAGGGPRIQTYGLDADANAWMGLGTDMAGNPYEHSLYFPYGAGGYVNAGRLTIGSYDGTTYSTKATFLSNGRIGFGIASPEAALHVAQSGQDDQLILGSAANNRDHAMFMYSGPNKAEVMRYQSGTRFILGGSSNITKTSIYGGGSERLTVESGGVTAYRIYSTAGGGYNLIGGSALVLGGSGASFDNTTGVRLTESYGPLWNCADSATWHHQIINGSSLIGFQASGGNYGSGRIYATGDITAYYSDGRLKHELNPIQNAVAKILTLTGYTYKHNGLGQELLKENPNKIHVGLIAQEVKNVLPEVVTIAPFDLDGHDQDGNGISRSGENYLTIKYERIVPLLIEGIKEQQAQITEQKAQIDELVAIIKTMKGF